MTNRDVFVATETGVTELKGVPFSFERGVTRVRAGHPLLKACPNCFALEEDTVTYEVEQATAAPGELRGQK